MVSNHSTFMEKLEMRKRSILQSDFGTELQKTKKALKNKNTNGSSNDKLLDINKNPVCTTLK